MHWKLRFYFFQKKKSKTNITWFIDWTYYSCIKNGYFACYLKLHGRQKKHGIGYIRITLHVISLHSKRRLCPSCYLNSQWTRIYITINFWTLYHALLYDNVRTYLFIYLFIYLGQFTVSHKLKWLHLIIMFI